MNDIRLAARQVVRYPGFSAVVIATLALGIGACTLIFSAVNGVLLKPLPYPEPERIVRVRQIGRTGIAADNISGPNFSDLQESARSFAALARYSVGSQPVSGGSEPTRARTAMVSGELFDVVGIRPLAGRTFLPEERDVGAAPVAVISHSYWQRSFGGDPKFGDRTLRIADRTYSIVGVMPAGFDYPDGAEIWTPAELWPSLGESRTAHNWRAVGRLADGVSLEQARAELSTIARGVQAQHGDATWMFDAAVDPLRDVMVRTARPALLVLLAAGGLLFAIAVANAANLVLARATTREQELGVRVALGAGRRRLASQFFAEMLLLCGAGGALGLLFAAWGIEALVQLAAGRLPRADAVGIDFVVLGFAVALTIATAACLSLMAAWRAGSRAVLRYNQRMGSGAPESPLAGGLVVTQIALALLLVAGAALLARSFLTLTGVDRGFRTDGLVFMDVSPPLTDDITELEPLVAFYGELIERLRALPGVEAIAGISLHPGSGGGWDATARTQITADEIQSFADLDAVASDPTRPEVRGTEYRLASDDYFATVGIPLLRGRVFGRSDGPDSERVAVVSPALAERLWPGEDPIGKLVQITMDGDLTPSTVVGIVGNVRGDYGIEREPPPTFYAPFGQHPRALRIFEVVMRTRDAADVVPAARDIVQQMNPEIVPQFSTPEQDYAAQLAPRRLNLVLIGLFGVTALLLALAGIYGSIAFHVARRTREIGVRIAIGAPPASVVSMVVRRSLMLATLGVAAGTAITLGASRLASALLYGIAPYDPVSYVSAAALLLVAAVTAGWIPALRAARVDPVTALRSE